MVVEVASQFWCILLRRCLYDGSVEGVPDDRDVVHKIHTWLIIKIGCWLVLVGGWKDCAFMCRKYNFCDSCHSDFVYALCFRGLVERSCLRIKVLSNMSAKIPKEKSEHLDNNLTKMQFRSESNVREGRALTPPFFQEYGHSTNAFRDSMTSI